MSKEQQLKMSTTRTHTDMFTVMLISEYCSWESVSLKTLRVLERCVFGHYNHWICVGKSLNIQMKLFLWNCLVILHDHAIQKRLKTQSLSVYRDSYHQSWMKRLQKLVWQVHSWRTITINKYIPKNVKQRLWKTKLHTSKSIMKLTICAAPHTQGFFQRISAYSNLMWIPARLHSGTTWSEFSQANWKQAVEEEVWEYFPLFGMEVFAVFVHQSWGQQSR